MLRDQQSISRRQLLEQSAFGLGSLFLLAPDRSRAAEEALDLPPIFEGDAPISDGWRKRLAHKATNPLVELLLTAAGQRLADPLPGTDIAQMLARPDIYTVDVADPAIQVAIAAGLAKAALFLQRRAGLLRRQPLCERNPGGRFRPAAHRRRHAGLAVGHPGEPGMA